MQQAAVQHSGAASKRGEGAQVGALERAGQSAP